MSDEFRDLERPLADFRAAVRSWSGQAQAPPARTGSWIPRLRWAAAAAMACALAAIPVYEKLQRDRQHALEVAKQDEALLQQIDADLARSVPAPFEPLTQLVTFPTSTTKETK